jgi:hypothetical protein
MSPAVTQTLRFRNVKNASAERAGKDYWIITADSAPPDNG